MEREAASRNPRAGTTWPDTVDDIFGGDCVVTLGYVTPASGVVLTPLTNFAVRDRSAGTLTALNSSVGVWKKLARGYGEILELRSPFTPGTAERVAAANTYWSKAMPLFRNQFPSIRGCVRTSGSVWNPGKTFTRCGRRGSACGRCASTSRLQSKGSWPGPSSTAAERPRCTALHCRSRRLHLSPHQVAARARESTSRERRGRRRACRTSCLAG